VEEKTYVWTKMEETNVIWTILALKKKIVPDPPWFCRSFSNLRTVFYPYLQANYRYDSIWIQ